MDRGFVVEFDSNKGTASSVVVGRIRTARKLTDYERSEYPPVDAWENRLEDFIHINNLDEGCAKTLRNSTVEAQQYAMEPNFVYRNLDSSKGTASSLCVGKLTKFKRTMGHDAGQHHVHAPRMSNPAPVHHAPVHHAPVHHAPVHHAPVHHAPVHHGSAHRAPAHNNPTEKKLQSFIEYNKLDRPCADALYSLDMVQMNSIMDKGFHLDVDPSKGSASAMVIARVKRARQMSKSELENYPSMDAFNHRVNDFARINGLDDRCVQMLTSSTLEVQQSVMEMGFIIDVDHSKGNASSAVVWRIKKAAGTLKH